MKIKLKNIRHNAAMSEETHCFSASLYVDGVKIGTIGNRGHGGCDEFHGDRDAYARADTWCRANLPKWGTEYDEKWRDTDLEMHICDLVNRHLIRQDMKRMMRTKILFVENGNLMQVSYKGTRKIDQRHIDNFRQRHPGVVPLNDMPEDKALETFRAHAA